MTDWSFSQAPRKVVVEHKLPTVRPRPGARSQTTEERFARFVAMSRRPVHEHVRLEPEPEPTQPSSALPLHPELVGPLRNDPRPIAEVTDVLIEIIEF